MAVLVLALGASLFSESSYESGTCNVYKTYKVYYTRQEYSCGEHDYDPYQPRFKADVYQDQALAMFIMSGADAESVNYGGPSCADPLEIDMYAQGLVNSSVPCVYSKQQEEAYLETQNVDYYNKVNGRLLLMIIFSSIYLVIVITGAWVYYRHYDVWLRLCPHSITCRWGCEGRRRGGAAA